MRVPKGCQEVPRGYTRSRLSTGHTSQGYAWAGLGLGWAGLAWAREVA